MTQKSAKRQILPGWVREAVTDERHDKLEALLREPDPVWLRWGIGGFAVAGVLALILVADAYLPGPALAERAGLDTVIAPAMAAIAMAAAWLVAISLWLTRGYRRRLKDRELHMTARWLENDYPLREMVAWWVSQPYGPRLTRLVVHVARQLEKNRQLAGGLHIPYARAYLQIRQAVREIASEVSLRRDLRVKTKNLRTTPLLTEQGTRKKTTKKRAAKKAAKKTATKTATAKAAETPAQDEGETEEEMPPSARRLAARRAHSNGVVAMTARSGGRR